jgi:ABC-type uncharacterized transport system substrate-binding protein
LTRAVIEILGKRFELLKEMLPNFSRLTIMFNPDFAHNHTRLTSMTETARALGLTLVPVEARGSDALEQAFAMIVRERAQAFVVSNLTPPGNRPGLCLRRINPEF